MNRLPAELVVRVLRFVAHVPRGVSGEFDAASAEADPFARAIRTINADASVSATTYALRRAPYTPCRTLPANLASRMDEITLFAEILAGQRRQAAFVQSHPWEYVETDQHLVRCFLRSPNGRAFLDPACEGHHLTVCVYAGCRGQFWVMELGDVLYTARGDEVSQVNTRLGTAVFVERCESEGTYVEVFCGSQEELASRTEFETAMPSLLMRSGMGV